MTPEAPIATRDYRVSLLPEAGVSGSDLIDFWVREDALDQEQAAIRLQEALVVSVHPTDGVVGVSTANLRRNPRLRMDLWYFRSFVSASHRKAGLGLSQSVLGREHLSRRFTTGEDERASGILYEVESPMLKDVRGRAALWDPPGFTYIGPSHRGYDLRVHYFPGAPAPAPFESGTRR